VSDIQRESQAVLKRIKENCFHGAFEAWKKRWDHYIHSQGDYFEGDGSQNWVSQHFFSDLVRELSNSTSYYIMYRGKVTEMSLYCLLVNWTMVIKMLCCQLRKRQVRHLGKVCLNTYLPRTFPLDSSTAYCILLFYLSTI
jgi:hypothetical protein